MANKPLLLLAAAAILAALPLDAKLPWVKKAQGLGFKEIQNCQSCHVDKTPKKGGALNDLGKWLMAQKDKHKAADVDLAWLKDYKGK